MTLAEPTDNIPSGDNRLLGDECKNARDREVGTLPRT